MASLGVSGVGVVFRRYTTSVGAEIAEIRSISGPSTTRETIDVTSFDSTGGYREFISALRDAGEIQLDLIFTRDAWDTLRTDLDADDLVNYEIVLPDDENSSFDFAGLVTACEMNIPLDDVITFTCTIKISGQLTTDSGSG